MIQSERKEDNSTRTIQTCDTRSPPEIGCDTIEQQLKDIKEMIAFLLQYQQDCIDKVDLQNAKQTRNRIKMFVEKESKLKETFLINNQEKQVMNMTIKNDGDMDAFDMFWNQFLQKMLKDFYKAEKKMKEFQKAERKELCRKLEKEEACFKGSIKLNAAKKKMVGFMKLHMYDEAEQEEKNVKDMETEERKIWQEKMKKKKQYAIQLLSKRHKKEFEILQSKNQDALQRKIRQRDKNFETMVKRHEVKQKQLTKASKELARTLSSLSLNSTNIFL